MECQQTKQFVPTVIAKIQIEDDPVRKGAFSGRVLIFLVLMVASKVVLVSTSEIPSEQSAAPKANLRSFGSSSTSKQPIHAIHRRLLHQQSVAKV